MLFSSCLSATVTESYFVVLCYGVKSNQGWNWKPLIENKTMNFSSSPKFYFNIINKQNKDCVIVSKCDNLSRVISMRIFIDLLYDPFVCIIHVFPGVFTNTKVQRSIVFLYCFFKAQVLLTQSITCKPLPI